MMNLLAPAALTGLLLLAIPVAVHLFKPRKMRQTPFSSLRWLRMTQQRWSRRIRWHQLFLFALRAAFIILLVLALTRPLWNPHAGSKYTDRFVVVDVSRSMAYEAAGRATPLERAKQLASEILTRGRAGDRTALLFTGSTTQIVTPPTVDARAFLPTLEAVQAGQTDTNLGSALAVIRPMLGHCRPETDAEVYVLTDNHQQSWTQGEIAAFTRDLPISLKVEVIDVGVKGAANGWIADARLVSRPAGSRAQRLIQVDLGCTGDQPQERTLRIVGVPGSEVIPERTITLEPDRPMTVVFEIPAGSKLQGQVAEVRLEPADALPSDDRFFLNLDPPTTQHVLLVDADGPADETPRSGLHLKAALASLAQGERMLDVVRRSTSAATPADFSAADVIFLAGVPELMPPQLEALELRVKAGAGLVVFLGPGLRLDFYNNRLYKPQLPADGLLGVPVQAEEGARNGSTATFTNLRWDHRLLAPLHDPVFGDLGGTRIHYYYRFTASPADGDTVLASIGDSIPGIVERSVGAGRVLLFNTTANDDWADLPRRKSFVPLVDRMLTYLAGGSRRGFTTGEAATLPLPGWNAGEPVTVQTPGGNLLTPVLGGVAGRGFLRLPPLTESGIYRVERPSAPERSFRFAVNVGPGDSVLAPIDPATLASWFEPVPAQVVDPEEAATRLSWSSAEVILWPWLVSLAGLVFIAETFFVHWLCPRMNPALANVVVRRHRTV